MKSTEKSQKIKKLRIHKMSTLNLLTPNPQNVNLEFVESEKGEFDRVISKLEIFVIKNKSIFDGG